MDLNDFEKEISDIKTRAKRGGRSGPDYGVKHAQLKAAASKAIAVLFFLAIVLFGILMLTKADTARIDFKVAVIVAILYVGLGAFVALKLWKIEVTGWVALFFIALAGIGLPAISALNHGIMVGTIPIIAASVVTMVVLYWIRDLYRIKKFGDMFRAPQ